MNEDPINVFNPDGYGVKGNIFGLPFSPENARVVLIPVPWEVTVSYHTGTAFAPQSILNASTQVDLYVNDIPEAWKAGIAMLPIPLDITNESERLRSLVMTHVNKLESGMKIPPADPILTKINEGCENLNVYVKSIANRYIKAGKLVGLIGGDHSTPLGLIRALSEVHDRFGVLQIDAHADLRKSYQGFTYSHASIMYNALKLPSVSRLVQVGIRDLCEEERGTMKAAGSRIVTFFNDDLQATLFKGTNWDAICDKIISTLPEKVYISFDVDGLKPYLCPNTGTPVPGGLEFDEATYLLKRIVLAGKKIIGFDLCEVGVSNANDWDSNVAARLLYRLCNLMAVSQQKLAIQKT